MMKIRVGDTFQFQREVFGKEVDKFAYLTGDLNPLHVDENFAKNLPFKKRVVHGMLIASMTSRLVGIELSCPGALWAQQEFRFLLPVFIGDILNFTMEVLQLSSATKSIRIRITVKRDKEIVLDGEGTVVLRYAK